MLNKKNRIADRQRIQWLLKKGKTYKTPYFVFRFLAKEEPPSQFAVIVSKKVSKKAVDRNRIKRQITEALRLNMESIKGNIQALIIAKNECAEGNYEQITKHILQFFNHFSNSECKID